MSRSVRDLVADEPLEVDDVHALGAEHVEPRRQEVGVAPAAERHVLLVVGIEEVVGAEAVGRGEVVLDRVVGGEAQPDLLVAEERDGAAHRLAQHDERVRVRRAGRASPRRRAAPP